MTDDKDAGNADIDKTAPPARPLSRNVGRKPKVRRAGPDAMPDLSPKERRKWDEIDEASDESFPSSDPPGQGVG